MLNFLVEEGVISTGVLSGIFTVGLLTSLKNNIIEPLTEHVLPSVYFHDTPTLLSISGNTITRQPNKEVKWKVFIRDFIVWFIVMCVLYLFITKVIHKYRKVR